MCATEHMWKTEGNLWEFVPCFHYVALVVKMGVRSWDFTRTLLPAQPFLQPRNYSIFSFLFGTVSQDIPQNSWCSCLSFSRYIDKGVHHHISLPFAFQIKKSNFRRCKWLLKFLSFMILLRQPRDCSNYVGWSLWISEASQVFSLHCHWSKNVGLIEDILKFPFHPVLLVLALLHGYHLEIFFCDHCSSGLIYVFFPSFIQFFFFWHIVTDKFPRKDNWNLSFLSP